MVGREYQAGLRSVPGKAARGVRAPGVAEPAGGTDDVRMMNRTLHTSWKPTKAQILAAPNKLVPDLVAEDLIVLFAGINPGIRRPSRSPRGPLGGSHAWVLPNPSGLNAHYQPAALAQLFGDLRLWAVAQQGSR